MNPISSVGVALASALVVSTPMAATGLIETAAHCVDGSSIQSTQGSSPSATCDRAVSEGGPPYRVGATNAEALVTSSLRSGLYKQGVSAAAKTILNTNGPDKVFGARAYVSVLDGDWFAVSALDHRGVEVHGGTLVVHLKLSGSLLLSGSALESSFSRLTYAVTLENSFGEESRASGAPRLDSQGVQIVNQDISVPVRWSADGRIDLSMSMVAELGAFVDQTGSAAGSSSFSNSLEWLGIDQVKDENGVAVASFLALNPETGVNWGTPSPVPEPAVSVLLAAGLLLIAKRYGQRHAGRLHPGKFCASFLSTNGASGKSRAVQNDSSAPVTA